MLDPKRFALHGTDDIRVIGFEGFVLRSVEAAVLAIGENRLTEPSDGISADSGNLDG